MMGRLDVSYKAMLQRSRCVVPYSAVKESCLVHTVMTIMVVVVMVVMMIVSVMRMAVVVMMMMMMMMMVLVPMIMVMVMVMPTIPFRRQPLFILICLTLPLDTHRHLAPTSFTPARDAESFHAPLVPKPCQSQHFFVLRFVPDEYDHTDHKNARGARG